MTHSCSRKDLAATTSFCLSSTLPSRYALAYCLSCGGGGFADVSPWCSSPTRNARIRKAIGSDVNFYLSDSFLVNRHTVSSFTVSSNARQSPKVSLRSRLWLSSCWSALATTELRQAYADNTRVAEHLGMHGQASFSVRRADLASVNRGRHGESSSTLPQRALT
jgi:hypothetical protein